ncbi:acetoacetate--CoA ligase [Mycolicibacter sinensis]
MTDTTGNTADPAAPIWRPATEAGSSQIATFAAAVQQRHGTDFDILDYQALWRWSVDNLEEFWQLAWEACDIRSTTPHAAVLAHREMPGAVWFDGAHVNFAEHALRRRGGKATPEPAVISIDEDGAMTAMSLTQLRDQVGALTATLAGLGVRAGDRIVGYLSPGPEAIVALLATASLGAVWSQCAPDYGAAAVIDRFGQLAPVVMFAATEYRYHGRHYDRGSDLATIEDGLPTLRQTITVNGQVVDAGSHRMEWAAAIAHPSPPRFTEVAFDHPLWVLFTSGTTGRPKGIVHGHGGVTLGLGAQLLLQMDLTPESRLLWYTSTNWMMWNLVVSSLLCGSTAVIYNGSPTYPHVSRMWECVAAHKVTHFGTSPAYLSACQRAGIRPAQDYDLGDLAVLGSTGSPLPAAAYRWVHSAVGGHVQVVSSTGGTDVVAAFAGGAPTTPVWPGEISAPSLGVALEAWDDDGNSVIDQVGELVVTAPIPSMPLYFWNDPDGSRYREAYFSRYPGVWRHGDWITVTDRGTVIVHGRSDSTLNRRGVRLGSAEIYSALDTIPEITDSLVVGVEEGDGDYWMPLFVVLNDGAVLDGKFCDRVTAVVAATASPRHVPDTVIAVSRIPRTKTGKRVELPVKRILQGGEPHDVLQPDALDDPTAVEEFVDIARERLLRKRGDRATSPRR